jgi:hypothetical protein
MEIFSAAVNQAIHSAAPFASFPKEFGVSNGLVLISGGFGRECRVWIRSTSQSGKPPKTLFE